MNNYAQINQFKSFAQMLEVLPNDTACREYLENVRWNGSPVCPQCGGINPYQLKQNGEFRGMYKCSTKLCKQRFTVTVGTMFEGSHISLRKWFIAIYIFSTHKKGISSHQLSRDLGVTQKTAWFMLGRIRNSFKTKDISVKLDGVIQCDESFVGGKNKNRHANKKVEESQGRSVKDKTPVFGMVQDGSVHTYVVADTKATTLKPIIHSMVTSGSIVVTDEWLAYKGLAKNYAHVVVNHKRHEYVNGDFHTNSIEGFWSLLKRGIFGIYHQVSPKHLQTYCHEFAYRYNARKISTSEMFDFSLHNTMNCRLTYKQLIAN